MVLIPRRLVLPLVLALAVTLLAGCGGDDEAEQVASLSEEDGSSGDDGRQGIEDALLDFTQCLRDEGIDVPDVQLDASGAPIIRPEDVAGIDLESPEVQGAADICLPILTDAGAFSFADDPELQALLQDSLQEFAVCMRREGITDFPDPTTNSALPFPLTAFADYADQGFQDALDVCRREVGFPGLDG